MRRIRCFQGTDERAEAEVCSHREQVPLILASKL